MSKKKILYKIRNFLIKASGNIERYLTPEYIKAFDLDEGFVRESIEKSGNIEKYLAPEYIKAVGLDKEFVKELIEKSKNSWHFRKIVI